MADLADYSAEEQLEYKREYAIRQREEQMKQQQAEEIEKKKLKMDEQKRKEEYQKNQRAKEQADSYSKSQNKKRAAQMENEFREKCRESNITKKRNAWLQKENERMQDMLADHYAGEEEMNERLLEAKERKNMDMREDLEKRILFRQSQKQRNEQREAKEKEREEKRKEREIHRIDELKMQLDEEVDQYVEHPTHIPLKQALCGGLRPVPTVTKLLAAMRDMEEDLKDVKATILEDRARSLKKPLFTYVQELKETHSRNRLKPPEPEIDEKRARKKIQSANTTRGSSTGFGRKGR
eukprot:gnl/MRDRNA2_/MRDRNA2_89626_c0_seq1.p1 gnl/MRDRNA2_/MRDRNA2_89626_c0~~gnl/MRDRNA2_/MRDRNA2_89626_c0_seq1.p1  ORF type:complete len:295 (+),score=95.07 gnl/MRDRNA2_/MRDRNA2_89626_c0_seq1:91-975(+)